MFSGSQSYVLSECLSEFPLNIETKLMVTELGIVVQSLLCGNSFNTTINYPQSTERNSL